MDYHHIVKDDNSMSNDMKVRQEPKRGVLTHYIFLVHGWIGHSEEMKYFEQSLDEKISHDKHILRKKQCGEKGGCIEENDRINVHSITCNIGKTGDGIENGGVRLSNEVEEYILRDITEMNERGNFALKDGSMYSVTLSFVGNSLGGLYARYALSCIPTFLHLNYADMSGNMNSCKINLHYNVFMALAAPHMGLASNFPFKTSRTFEKIAAWLMGQTGKDLFFFDNINEGHKRKGESQSRKEKECLIYTMSTDYERFLQPLMRFKKRVAYINSFKTDICCHTTTAGFFSTKSTYPHAISADEKEDHDHPFIVATSSTEGDDYILKSKTPSYKSASGKYDTKKQLETQGLIMSNKLDSLGWTKVFIDSRKMNPIKTYRKIWRKSKSLSTWKDFIETQSQTTLESWESDSSRSKPSIPAIIMDDKFVSSPENIDTFKDDSFSSFSKSYEESEFSQRLNRSYASAASKDFHKYMTKNERVQIPVGHSMMIANSKDAFCEKLNRNGRPIVDYIVKNLIDDVNKFKLVERKFDT